MIEVICQVGNDVSVAWGALKAFRNEATDREKRLIDFVATILAPTVRAIGDLEIVRSAEGQNVQGILDGTRSVSIHMKGNHVEFKDHHPGESS